MMVEKKIKGRKRHIVTDTQGFLLGCYVGPANENDRSGIKTALCNMKERYNSVIKLFADMGYKSNNLKDYIKHEHNIDLEIVKRPPCRFWVRTDSNPEDCPKFPTGFKVQPKRWVIERTITWLGRNRRLAKEYERHTESTESLIYIAMSRLIIKRIVV